MKKPPTLARLIWLLIAVAGVAFFICIVQDQPAAAFAANGKIAFTSDNTIYTMNADGSGLNQLTPFGNGFRDRFPAWSPDGTKIAFGRTTFTVKSQIYVMNADGTNPTRITDNSSDDSQPAWSPDGTKIAFVSNRDGNNEIYVMNADGSNQTRLTNNTVVELDPAWSPDGTKIAFTSMLDATDFEIYVMSAAGNNPVRLTNNNSADRGPSWSPDGTKIAFSTNRLGLFLVYVMNADGSNQLNITQSASLDSFDPEWSPDGTTIAFTSYGRVAPTNADEVFLMNGDGSNIRRITTTPFDEHDLSWQTVAVAPPLPSPSPTPTPGTFTISGTVTDSNAQPLAGVAIVLLSDVKGTQVTFTDQNGNYSLNYAEGVSNKLQLTPTKTGYIFNPLSVIYISTSFLQGNRTQSFVGTPSIIPLPMFQNPILLTQENSLRALALDSATLMAEPFGVSNVNNFSSDQHTRVTLFAMNIDLLPGENASAIQAQAEDSLGQIVPLTVEYFGVVPNLTWLKQVVVRLPDQIANSVEVRVSLKVHDTEGNKVIVKVKP